MGAPSDEHDTAAHASQRLNTFSAIEPWLARELGAERVVIMDASLLAGGAVQQNWRVDVEVSGGPRAGRHAWVLRTDADAGLDVSLDRISEFRCIRVAHNAGVKVAEPIAASDDLTLLGRAFAIQALVSGSAQGRRIARDPALPEFGDGLAREIGGELARIHSVTPTDGTLSFLPVPVVNPSRREIATLRKGLDGASEARPALEYILSWLNSNAPEPRAVRLVHGDFRTGNYMVDNGRLTAVLDWEFCHWGDPREDLGWFIARCWRFGNDDRVAGGIAKLASLLEGYNAHAETKVAASELAYFEVLAAARWAAISLLQGDRFIRGGERSLELALTGLMPPEMEWDAIDIIDRLTQRGRVT
ncbi:MAG: phosphotransferase family protein [Hyphomicrobiaceae bacterium]